MHRRLKWVFVLLIATALYSADSTITLQKGSNGYDGCEDVSVFKTLKCEEYSFSKAGRKSYPTDTILVNADYCC